MKLGVFSDLHSNLHAMEAMLREPHVDQWICLGDFVGLFPLVNEVVEKIREKGILCIRGDHERALLSGNAMGNSLTANEVLERQRETISSENRAYIRSLKDAAEITLGGVRIYATHALAQERGSEGRKYLVDLGDMEKRFAGFDLVLFGHTHFPLTCYCKDGILVNPGSCGFPIDVARMASYVVLDTKRGVVELKRFDFDRAGLLKDILRFQYPMKLYDYLLRNFSWR